MYHIPQIEAVMRFDTALLVVIAASSTVAVFTCVTQLAVSDFSDVLRKLAMLSAVAFSCRVSRPRTRDLATASLARKIEVFASQLATRLLLRFSLDIGFRGDVCRLCSDADVCRGSLHNDNGSLLPTGDSDES